MPPIQCSLVSLISNVLECLTSHFSQTDHAQGGAQGIEDGLALGLVLHGAADPSQIEDRLILYEKIRRNRASAITVMSNFGFDEEAPEELLEYLEGQPIPSGFNPWTPPTAAVGSQSTTADACC